MENQTKIFVRDFRVDALVGIYPGDERVPTPLSITVEAIFSDYQIPTDKIDSTVSYDLIAEEIRRISKRHFNLIETMAEHLAEFCLAHPRISNVRVNIEKPIIFSEGPTGIEIFRSNKNV